MSSYSQTGVRVHDDAVDKILAQLRSANVGVTSQATLNANYITHYRNWVPLARVSRSCSG